MKPSETTTQPDDVELHYFRDADSKTTGYLVKIPDSRLEGMPGPDLKTILPTVWNSTRTQSQRIALLAQGVEAIDRYRPVGGPSPVVAKPRLRERFARWLNSFRRAKK